MWADNLTLFRCFLNSKAHKFGSVRKFHLVPSSVDLNTQAKSADYVWHDSDPLDRRPRMGAWREIELGAGEGVRLLISSSVEPEGEWSFEKIR